MVRIFDLSAVCFVAKQSLPQGSTEDACASPVLSRRRYLSAAMNMKPSQVAVHPVSNALPSVGLQLCHLLGDVIPQCTALSPAGAKGMPSTR